MTEPALAETPIAAATGTLAAVLNALVCRELGYPDVPTL